MNDINSSVRWEYRVVQYIGSVWNSEGEWDRPELSGLSTEQMLNHFGAKGWELISIGPVHGESSKPAAAYLFKRQIV